MADGVVKNGAKESTVGSTMTLETIKDSLKAEIRRELKIKEGAEKLAKVAKDKRSRNELSSILKQSNYKLQELHRQLNDVNAQVSDTDLQSPHGEMSPGSIGNGEAARSRLDKLEKQLAVELKVRQGAENMMKMYEDRKDKRMLAESMQMLGDAKQKIEVLRMKILQEQTQCLLAEEEAHDRNGAQYGHEEVELEERIDELKHRIDIETRVVAGCKNILRTFPDKKALSEAQARLEESARKLELLRLSLDRRLAEKDRTVSDEELSSEVLSPNRHLAHLVDEVGGSCSSPVSFRRSSTVARTAAITGTLFVRLSGVDELIDPVQRVRRASGSAVLPARGYTLGGPVHSPMLEIPKEHHRAKSMKSRPSGSSPETMAGNSVKAVLKLDQKEVACTPWRVPSVNAWEQTLQIDLDKVKQIASELHMFSLFLSVI
jgi:protein kinase N